MPPTKKPLLLHKNRQNLQLRTEFCSFAVFLDFADNWFIVFSKGAHSMEHLAETMTDFLLRHKYITEEQAEWCHYIYIECGDCQRAVSRSCKNLLCVFDTTGAPVIVPVHDVEYLFSTTVDKSECRAILTKANFCEL